MKIVVLSGGLSPERDVSLSSGCLIANALMESGHRVLLLDLYKGIEIVDYIDNLFIDADSGHRFSYTVPADEPDLQALKSEVHNGPALVGKNVLEICRHADLVFIALHGDIGENGELQALFDCYGIRYTGTGYIGSLLAMDKALAKELMCDHRISTPDWVVFRHGHDSLADAAERVGFPCVVKPCGCGSSVGVSMADNFEQLGQAVEAAGKYESTLIIEKKIEGREFSVGVLGGMPLPVIEIIPNEGFYDYAHKYQAGATSEVCPAPLPEGIAAELQAVALRVHTLLRLGSYSRIDFMLGADNRPWCLEANTLPGMTPTSLLPQEAAAMGITYSELCERIAGMAMHSSVS